MIVKRLTALVIAKRPTFWLNDVMGEQPKTPPETAEMKPSQQWKPEISFSVISFPSPPVYTALVSPVVSFADTINTSVADIMSPALNFGV